MPGPAPSRDPQRRNARPDWLQLPKKGRAGPAPKWPLAGTTPALWAELWKLPQAVAWSQMHTERVVARYVQLVLQAEKPDASPMVLGEARQLEDRLGLTPMAMKRLLWEVVDTEPVAPAQPAGVTSLDDRRKLLG